MTKRILIVEDDKALGFVIKDNLEIQGYKVDWVRTGPEGLLKFQEIEYDLIILDVMLPELDGFTLAEKIRDSDRETPVLFLSAKSMVEDRIEGLRRGGDDYLTKPFSMEELLLKIRIFLKRSSTATRSVSYSIGKYIFYPESLSLKLAGSEKILTQKESQLLELLCQKRETVLKREEILEAIWGTNDYFLGRSMDVFISKLRKHLKEDNHIQIINYHGVGFKLQIEE